MLADAAGLDGSFKSLTSDSKTDARDKVLTKDKSYYDVNGNPIAADFAHLSGQTLTEQILVTENGDVLEAYLGVWTGTRAGGIKKGSGSYCADWRSSSNLLEASSGQISWTDSNWLDTGSSDCSSTLHIYCLEDA